MAFKETFGGLFGKEGYDAEAARKEEEKRKMKEGYDAEAARKKREERDRKFL